MRMVLFSVCWIVLPTLAQAEKYRLEEPADDVRVFGVGMRLDVSGKVQTRGGDNQTLDLPMHAGAAISYRERRLPGIGRDAEALRSVRDYEQAQVDITIDNEKTAARLPDPLRLVTAQGRSAGLELYSLGGLLSAEELELITPPCDSLCFLALLPRSEVEIEEEWEPSPWVAPFLTRLEAVTKSELKCRLASVENNVARVTFDGSAKGAVQGAVSEITFNGSFDYDLASNSISAAELVQTEQRAIGVVSVGLDVKAHVRVLRKPAQVPRRLGDASIVDAAAAEPAASAMLLRFESPWNLSLLHSRDWHLFKQTDQVAIFRLLENGLFLAQCNLSPIPAAKPGEHTSAEVFENDIKQSLGSKLKTLTPAEVVPTGDRRFVQRVLAEGAVGERQLTWIYYMVTDPSGKQASLMFAIDASQVEKLDGRDRDFALSVRFGPPATTAILPK